MNLGLRKHFKRWLRRQESGQSVILLAIGFIALAAFVGITTDVSLMFVRYSQLARAVDSAAIAAANQMRQDRSIASVGLAARSFIEAHGLDPIDVLVETCQSVPIDQRATDELCIGDQSKLVRVTGQIISPTVFLRLVGWRDFRLQASSVSETATLDVVLIMDVSERMTRYTTIEDWARIGLGVVYIPPYADAVYTNKYPTQTPTTPTLEVFWRGTGPNAVQQDSLLNVRQAVVNNRLSYASGVATTPTELCRAGASCNLNTSTSETAYDVWYNATYFAAGPQGNYGTQYHPRQQCRVRFWPYAWYKDPLDWYGYYDDTTGNYVPLLQGPGGQPSLISQLGVPSNRNILDFNAFVPTYNYHGCCNDPNGDGNFEDLVCQPFRQARDATFQFLERIDFTRGDRVAFVTYDRSAFLVNPYGYFGSTQVEAEANAAARNEDRRLGGMIDNYEDARQTLTDLIGVRAEPNFYEFIPGAYSNSLNRLSARWGSAAIGINIDTGLSLTVNYDSVDPINYAAYGTVAGASDPNTQTLPPEGYNYPVYGNCPFDMAAVPNNSGAYRSLFAGGIANSSLPNETTITTNPYLPSTTTQTNPNWTTYNDGLRSLYTNNNGTITYTANMGYERWASCRTGNVGSALREANNALLNPRTIRQSGTVWVMVMLSASGAGASDPVRRNRQSMSPADPYRFVVTGVAPNQTGAFGRRGQYGAFGICPVGTLTNPGELLRTANDVTAKGNPSVIPPFCSDESPLTRHTCNFRPRFTFPNSIDPLGTIKRNVTADGVTTERTVPPLGDAFYTFYGETDRANPARPGPSSPVEETNWNRLNNRLYDVDIFNNPNLEDNCSFLYDTDDYARDWADYIAIRRTEGDANTLLPTIFTIGFGLEYARRTEGGSTYDIRNPAHTQKLCELNPSDCIAEQILRYIADVGDNNKLDNDYYQDLTDSTSVNPVSDGRSANEDFGSRDACQTDAAPILTAGGVTYDIDGGGMSLTEIWRQYGMVLPQQRCGNYYYAPDVNGLQEVFNDIASRMFTRLAR